MLPTDQPSPPAVPVPSTPTAQLPQTKLPPQSTSRGRWAALQTGTTSTPVTKQWPEQRQRLRHPRLVEILLRRSSCECPFVARPSRFESPALSVAKPQTGKARRKFRPASTGFLPPKILSADAWQRS